MLEFLNANQGLIATISLVVSITLAIIGFFINKNIMKISQSQTFGSKGKGNQAGNNLTDKSQNIGDGSHGNTQSHGK